MNSLVLSMKSFFLTKSNILLKPILCALIVFGFMSNNSLACDKSADVKMSTPIQNTDGSYTVSLDICIGDAGSEKGITIDFSNQIKGTIKSFSPAFLDADLLAIGSILLLLWSEMCLANLSLSLG